MFKTTKLVGLKQEGSNRVKWPSLQELHVHLFDYEFSGTHDAMADVNATAACYKKLVETGEICP
jgi:hypothetical protein